MEYDKTIRLRDGRECRLRSADARDAEAVLDVFIRTHGETDFLATYPEETSFTPEQEAQYLQRKAESEREIELIALLDGKIVGTAGVDAVSGREKLRHRASFGISLARDSWGLGIGRALTLACIECAAAAGYAQLELDVVEANARAVALYRSVGFSEYGRNPRGFRLRGGGWQPLLLMRLELD